MGRRGSGRGVISERSKQQKTGGRGGNKIGEKKQEKGTMGQRSECRRTKKTKVEKGRIGRQRVGKNMTSSEVLHQGKSGKGEKDKGGGKERKVKGSKKFKRGEGRVRKKNEAKIYARLWGHREGGGQGRKEARGVKEKDEE